MTDHITLPRSVVEQAIEALQTCTIDGDAVGSDSGHYFDDEFVDRSVSDLRAALAGAAQAEPAPIDMVLHCPKCGKQHIDAREFMLGQQVDKSDHAAWDWDNPPHRSHLCHHCGHIWRPADVPTNGVRAVGTKGKRDSPITAPQPAQPVAVGEVRVMGSYGGRPALGCLLTFEAETRVKAGDKLYSHPPQPAQPVAVPQGWKNIIPCRLHTDEWDSIRVGDYNNGWNDCQRKVVLALEAAAPTPPAATVLEPLTLDEVFDQVEILPASNSAPIDAFIKGIRFAEAAHAAKLAKRGGV